MCNQTAFINGELVEFGDKGVVPATSAGECCTICANATLQQLGCQCVDKPCYRGGPIELEKARGSFP